jgi:hypothetical protein
VPPCRVLVALGDVPGRRQSVSLAESLAVSLAVDTFHTHVLLLPGAMADLQMTNIKTLDQNHAFPTLPVASWPALLAEYRKNDSTKTGLARNQCENSTDYSEIPDSLLREVLNGTSSAGYKYRGVLR